MVQFASYLRRVLCKTRLIFPRINGPIVYCELLTELEALRESPELTVKLKLLGT